jgi:hypothetical protein
LALERGQCQGLAAIERRGLILHQRPSCCQQFGKAIDDLVFCGRDIRLHGGAEAGEHGGIDRLGFDTLTGCLGEATGLKRVDLDARQSGLAQGHFQCPVIGTCGLEDDARWVLGRRPGDQFGMAFTVIGELLNAACRVGVNIEMVFRDVDADGGLIGCWCYTVAHLFLSHACHPGRLEHPGIRSGRKEKKGAIKL